MISWMQRHNKYLVWTIWVATIAFIGAGFVGWGSYSFGSKAGNVAKVGDIEISQKKLNVNYSNLYQRYSSIFKGKFDEAKAKEMGLIQQAFSTLVTQARVLNFAKDHGIIVSDEEVAKVLESIRAFQKDGVFNREIYKGYLRSQRLKAKVFEENLKDDIIVNKTLSLFQTSAVPFEEEVVSSALNIADKISYEVLTPEDVNFIPNESDIKTYWEAHKTEFLTIKKYELSIVWEETSDTEIDNEELKTFYAKNSFIYMDKEGKQLPFEEARERAAADLKIKKTKKRAQKSYIAFKKGEKEATEKLTLPIGSPALSENIWSEILNQRVGDILKPKVVGNRYAIVKLEAVIEPRIKSFEEANTEVKERYTAEGRKKALLTVAESTLKNLSESNATTSDFLSLEQHDNLMTLNSQESLQFLQKLFTSMKEKGIISISNKIVVYKIIDQKFSKADENNTALIKESTDQMKMRTFESNFIKLLDDMYTVEVYVKGLTN